MRLTNCVFRWKKALPGGHLWRGKYRLYREVTPLAKEIQKRRFDLEEKNMFYLRHPYLTPEESYGHGKALGHPQQFLEKHKAAKLKWRDDVTIGDRFGFLKVSDKWDFVKQFDLVKRKLSMELFNKLGQSGRYRRVQFT